MRFRRVLPPLLAAAVMLVVASSARAGGSWLEPDRRAYVAGDVATLRGVFSMTGSLEGRLSDGPYVGYLLEEWQWIERGRIPAGAIRLGELRIVRADGRHPTHAVVTFEIPSVPTGWYHVGYCNDPCTVDGIGDLVGGDRFVVAPTRVEGLAIVRIDRLATRVANVRHDVVARTRDERERLERALEARNGALDLAEARISQIQAELVRAAPSLGGSAGRPLARPSSVTWWIALLACIAGLGAGLAIPRRRIEPEILVPDTIPDDLEERAPIRLPR